jgi:phosphoglycerol transferase MdoB-like AlkP superfamily enzyme
MVFRMSPRLRLFLAITVGFFAAFAALRAGFYFYFLQGSIDEPLGVIAQAFSIGLRLDLRIALLVALPVVLLTLLPGFLNLRRSRIMFSLVVVWLALAAVGSLLFYIFDFGHYSYLGERINSSVLRFLEDGRDSLSMVWQSYPVIPLLLVVGAIGVGASWWWHRLVTRYTQRTPIRRGWIKAVVISFAWVLVYLHGIMGTIGTTYPLRWSDAYFANNKKVAALGLNPFVYFYSSMENEMRGWDEEVLRAQYPRVASWLGVDDPDPETFDFTRTVAGEADPKRPNVVFIHLESLGANRMGLYGNPLNATPNLDRMGRNGLFFPNFLVPSSGTARSIFSLITGVPDVSWGGRTASRNPQIVDQYTLVNEFEGYEKFFFIGGNAGWANIRGVIKNNVNNLELFEEGDYDAPKVDVWGVSDRSLFKAAHQRLKRIPEDKRFVAFITTAGNHRPFTIPDDDSGFQVRDLPRDKLRKHGFLGVDQYNGARLLDYNIGYYIDELVEGSWYEDNTIYVMYADHNNRTSDTTHMGYTEELELTDYYVPFIIYGPGVLEQSRTIEKPASLVDAIPTALGIAGLPYEKRTLGRDLLSWEKPGYALTFGGARHSNPTLGLLGSDYYLSMLHDGSKTRLYPLVEASKDNEVSGEKPAVTADRKAMLRGLYQTARYMMHNNKPD